MDVPPHIFRAYDIRGKVATELTAPIVRLIGQAFGSVAQDHKASTVVVAGDVRLSTELLRKALMAGLTSSGVDIVDLGMVPTPVLYYATAKLDTGCGVMITGSHNPPEFNGLKLMLNGFPYADEDLQELLHRIGVAQFRVGKGTVSKLDILPDYRSEIIDSVTLQRKLRIAVDCGNGATSTLVPSLFQQLGCQVTSLFATPDGSFPNHHPDPVKASNLQDLIRVVTERHLDLGIAFDGDGDRLGVVTPEGKIVQADVLLAYLARDVLRHNPHAPIIVDVKCGQRATNKMKEYGADLVIWKTGHTNIKAKIRSTKAPLGGEFSGHICFADRWNGFDDALYNACRLLESLSNDNATIDDYVRSLEPWFITPEIEVETSEERKFEIIQHLQKKGEFYGGSKLVIDGVRIDYDDSWGLIRASNTAPKLTLRFEAKTTRSLVEIQQVFREQLQIVAPEVTLPALIHTTQ